MAVGPYGALLDAVRGVRWPARRPVAGGTPGAHRSRTRGVAPEFAEYRPYRQGDDSRRIDWKLLGRSDRAFIRLAPDHAVLGTTFIVDASASMDFPSGGEGKWQLAKRLVVGLAAVAHSGADPVGLVLEAGGRVRRLEPRTRAGVIAEIARTLDETMPAGSAALAPHVTGSASRCVVISDGLGDIDALRAALARHRVRGGESLFVHVVARREIDPGATTFTAVDPEDHSLQRPIVAATRDEYRARFADWRSELAGRMQRDGIAFAEVIDDASVESAVRRIAVPPRSGDR